MHFVKESVIAASAHTVFAFHEQPDALARLTPPWQQMVIVDPPTSLLPGTRVRLRAKESAPSGGPSRPSTSPLSPDACSRIAW